MARHSAAPLSKASKARKFADVDDDILDPDSEEDEFTNYSSKGLRGGEDEDDDDDEDEGSEEDDEGEFAGDSEEEGDGVATWEPDNWDGASESESEEESEDERVQMKKLQKGLNDIPLATLMKAQKSLRRQADESDSEGEPGPSSKENKLAAMKARLAEMQRAKGKATGVVLGDDSGPSRKPRREQEEETERERQKRENKHAPTMMSTKKQVSRARQVVDVPKKASRDPRFSSLSAGQVDAHLHAQGYAFLPQLLRDEMKNLRQAVAAATKAEKTCKLYEKPRFTAERERLELELARVRTKVERTERENRNREVLSAAKRAEREKREQGKGAWYMKKSEKRDLLLKAKFDSLEEKGGKGAVKKAMDKKMKKVAAKEKKSRPFKAGGGGGGGREGAGEGNKRRRVA